MKTAAARVEAPNRRIASARFIVIRKKYGARNTSCYSPIGMQPSKPVISSVKIRKTPGITSHVTPGALTFRPEITGRNSSSCRKCCVLWTPRPAGRKAVRPVLHQPLLLGMSLAGTVTSTTTVYRRVRNRSRRASPCGQPQHLARRRTRCDLDPRPAIDRRNLDRTAEQSRRNRNIQIIGSGRFRRAAIPDSAPPRSPPANHRSHRRDEPHFPCPTPSIPFHRPHRPESESPPPRSL